MSQPPDTPELVEFIEHYDSNDTRKRAMMLKKNHDYSGLTNPWKNMMQCEVVGIPAWLGIVVRNMDKSSRIEELVLKEPKVDSEPLIDLFDDRPVYDNFASTQYHRWLTLTTPEERREFREALRKMAIILQRKEEKK